MLNRIRIWGDQHWQGEGLLAKAYLGYARHVPPHPAKIRVFRWLGRTLFSHGVRLTGHGGTRLRVDPNDYIGHEIAFSGADEPRSIALAKRLLASGGTFLDVGANFGLYTCPVSRIPGVRCIAVDASATAFTLLQSNLALNAPHQVQAVNAGLGSTSDLLPLELARAGNLGTTRVASAGAGTKSAGTLVASVRLSDLLVVLGISQVELMKIDVEGFEYEVMQGMDLGPGRGPMHIIMEHSEGMASEWHDPTRCHELLAASGYRPYTVTGVPYTQGMTIPEENLWWSRVEQRVEELPR